GSDLAARRHERSPIRNIWTFRRERSRFAYDLEWRQGDHPKPLGHNLRLLTAPILQPVQSASTAFSTAWTWPGTFTLRQTSAILPSLSMRKVERSTPIYLRPYMLFSTQTPYFSSVFFSESETRSTVS